MKNRGGSIDFRVDKDLIFTFRCVKFEGEQENANILKAFRLFESETQEGVFCWIRSHQHVNIE